MCFLTPQLLAVELLGDAVGVQESLAFARLLRAHARAALLVVERDPRLLREHFHGLGEGQVVDLLHEGDDVATLAASKTVEHAQVGAHVEGGGALIVEGTQPLERADPGALEGDMLADDILDPGALTHRLDILAPDQSRHRAIVGEGADILRQGRLSAG